MEITDVIEVKCVKVETDNSGHYDLTRYGPDNWLALGRPMFNCEDIEKLYQEWLAMEIAQVNEVQCFIIKTKDSEPKYYVRFLPDNWTILGKVMPNCEKMEKLYQEWLARNKSDPCTK